LGFTKLAGVNLLLLHHHHHPDQSHHGKYHHVSLLPRPHQLAHLLVHLGITVFKVLLLQPIIEREVLPQLVLALEEFRYC
jgi:hypothetical protein